MSINIRNRIPQRSNNVTTQSYANATFDEIESLLNKIAITRTQFAEPLADYMRFDNNDGKLYLHTIEGDTYEIGITKV